jgi:hypothetical protein
MDPGPADPISADKQVLERQIAAVRIQAAAVAAQQAELTEQELKLRRQEEALAQQREELAAHLDARRDQLLALQERARLGREQLEEDRKAQGKEAKELRAKSEASHGELQDALKQAAAERQRLVALNRRLKRRFHRQWAGERQRLQDLERATAERTATVQARTEALERERAALAEERLKFNGEVELDRRKIRDASTELREEKRIWQAQCAADQAAIDQGIGKLKLGHADLARSEREWGERQRQAQHSCERLAREAEGLERRVRNLRRKLLDQEQEGRRLEAVLENLRGQVNAQSVAQAPPAAPAPTLPTPAADSKESGGVTLAKPGQAWSAATALAARMVDSRSHLLELCARIVAVWQQWQVEREDAVRELNQAGARLAEREESLTQREQGLAAVESDLRRRLATALEAQHYCASWHARLLAEEAAGRAERAAALAKARQREAHAERTATLLGRLCELWAVRRRGELETLRVERARCVDLQRQCAELREEALQRNQRLEREARALEVRALTLEEHRLHFIATADDAARTERRLVRLRQRWDKRFEAAERKLARDAEAFQAARAVLEGQAEELGRLNDDLASREEKLHRDQAAWELGLAQAEIDRSRMEADLHSLRLHREALEHQVAQERGEIDRVALLLIEEGKPAAPAMMRAA